MVFPIIGGAAVKRMVKEPSPTHTLGARVRDAVKRIRYPPASVVNPIADPICAAIGKTFDGMAEIQAVLTVSSYTTESI